MAKDMFSIDARDLQRLKRFYRRAPREMKRATAGVINSIAFEDRKESIAAINRSMTIRNKKFVEGALKVRRTRITEINRQEAISGSINRDRFTGWDEQQFGRSSPMNRTMSVMGRTSGSWNKQMGGSNRLKTMNTFANSNQMPRAKTADGRATAMFIWYSRTKNRKPFIINSGSKYRHGVYKLKGKKISMMQSFEDKPKPRRNPWKTTATTRMKRRVNLRMIWAKEINRVLNRARK